MDEFIKLLNQNYELVQYRIKDKAVIFDIQSSKKELTCPFCGSKVSAKYSCGFSNLLDSSIIVNER